MIDYDFSTLNDKEFENLSKTKKNVIQLSC